MDLYLPLRYLFIIQFIIFGGYYLFEEIFYSEFKVERYLGDNTLWTSCRRFGPIKPLCNLTINNPSKYQKLRTFDALLENANPFYIDIQAHNETSQEIWRSLKQAASTPIMDEQIIWSESNTVPPFIYLDGSDAEREVYSISTLKKKVPNMPVDIKFDSMTKCIQSASKPDQIKLKSNESCIVPRFILSLAKAFLNPDNKLVQGRGALCHLRYKAYTCCQNDKHQNIECSSYNPWMLGVYYTTLIITALAFLGFPAIFVSFPDEKDSSETISGNTQVSNPLYRVAICADRTIRRYSARYYFVNMLTKLLIGLLLPLFFYMSWVFTEIILERKASDRNLTQKIIEDEKDMLRMPYQQAFSIYVAIVLAISLLPRTESLDFSIGYYQKNMEYQRSLINNARNDSVSDLMKPSWSLIRKIFIKLGFGFYGCADGGASLCWRFIKFVLSCFLIFIVFPVIALFILIGYGLYLSPLGRQISILLCYADIYFCRFGCCVITSFKRLRKRPERHATSDTATSNFVLLTIIRAIGFLAMLPLIIYSLWIIIRDSLQILSNFIIYLYIGILTNNDEFLPLIALISLFVLYMWNICSSVGNDYKTLLEITFHKCKRYQRKEKKRIIKFDKNGIPRIQRLSDLFQKVCDEVHPFTKEYTIMCLKLVIIALFLSLTYCCISVFGKTLVSKLTSALAVALGGLIPKLIQMFSTEASEHLEQKENAYRIKRIVHDFFTSENAQVVKKSPSQEKGNDDCEQEISSDEEKSEGSSINKSDSSSRRSSECNDHQLEVDVDIVPSQLANGNDDDDDPSTEKIPLFPSKPSITDQKGRNDETSM